MAALDALGHDPPPVLAQGGQRREGLLARAAPQVGQESLELLAAAARYGD